MALFFSAIYDQLVKEFRCPHLRIPQPEEAAFGHCRTNFLTAVTCIIRSFGARTQLTLTCRKASTSTSTMGWAALPHLKLERWVKLVLAFDPYFWKHHFVLGVP